MKILQQEYHLPVHNLKDEVAQLTIWTTEVPEETFRIITQGCFILLSCRKQNTSEFIQEVGRLIFTQWYLDKKDELDHESVRNNWPFKLHDTHLWGGVIQDFATIYLIYHIDWTASTALCYEIYAPEFNKNFFVRKEDSVLYPLSERHLRHAPKSPELQQQIKAIKRQILRSKQLIRVYFLLCVY